MPGTLEGGKLAAATNRKLYGADFYRVIGRKGGKISRGGGFSYVPGLASEAGRKGGMTVRRNAKQVALYSENGERLAVYKSVEQAHKATGVAHGTIWAAAKHERPMKNGQLWRYL